MRENLAYYIPRLSLLFTAGWVLAPLSVFSMGYAVRLLASAGVN